MSAWIETGPPKPGDEVVLDGFVMWLGSDGAVHQVDGKTFKVISEPLPKCTVLSAELEIIE